MSVEQIIKQKLTETFKPDILKIVNESEKHLGHAGDDGSGESHFKITISASALKENTRVNAHRKIHECLQHELKSTIHALSINII